MAKEYSRIQRVEDLIQRELALFLQKEVRDPRLSNVTISGVKVSRDLSHARVYITLLNEETQLEETLQALNKASGYLRYLLANSIELRITPELKFVHDVTMSQANKLSALIDAAVAADKEKQR